MTKEFLTTKCPNKRLRERFLGDRGRTFPECLVIGAAGFMSHSSFVISSWRSTIIGTTLSAVTIERH